MTKPTHHDSTRQQAAQAGRPPDVHDPTLLAAYAAHTGHQQVAGGSPAKAASKPKAKR